MSTFDPEEPCRVHDRQNNRTFKWKTRLAEAYKRDAVLLGDGMVSFDGLILDGWTTA
jgi:hypothetical protein